LFHRTSKRFWGVFEVNQGSPPQTRPPLKRYRTRRDIRRRDDNIRPNKSHLESSARGVTTNTVDRTGFERARPVMFFFGDGVRQKSYWKRCRVARQRVHRRIRNRVRPVPVAGFLRARLGFAHDRASSTGTAAE